MRSIQCTLTVSECLNGTGTNVFHSYFRRLDHSKATRQNITDLWMSKDRTGNGERGIYYSETKSLSVLPLYIKTEKYFIHFKIALKKFLRIKLLYALWTHFEGYWYVICFKFRFFTLSYVLYRDSLSSVVNVNIVHLCYLLLNANFSSFIDSHSLHRTSWTSPCVTLFVKHLIIPLLLLSTQSSHHEPIQQSSNNSLTLPLRNSCLFWVVLCFCIYACSLCCEV